MCTGTTPLSNGRAYPRGTTSLSNGRAYPGGTTSLSNGRAYPRGTKPEHVVYLCFVGGIGAVQTGVHPFGVRHARVEEAHEPREGRVDVRFGAVEIAQLLCDAHGPWPKNIKVSVNLAGENTNSNMSDFVAIVVFAVRSCRARVTRTKQNDFIAAESCAREQRLPRPQFARDNPRPNGLR